MPVRQHPNIGCCGIDCGLCPRYYTAGDSRCPGCGGESFFDKHPSCSFVTCCLKKRGLEVCAQCGDFPCRKFDKETGGHDSFVTHRRVMQNQRMIAEGGLDAFLRQQQKRTAFLETALGRYDDGRSKSFFCLAAALLSTDALNEALKAAERGENLRSVLEQLAINEGQELKLHK